MFNLIFVNDAVALYSYYYNCESSTQYNITGRFPVGFAFCIASLYTLVYRLHAILRVCPSACQWYTIFISLQYSCIPSLKVMMRSLRISPSDHSSVLASNEKEISQDILKDKTNPDQKMSYILKRQMSRDFQAGQSLY